MLIVLTDATWHERLRRPNTGSAAAEVARSQSVLLLRQNVVETADDVTRRLVARAGASRQNTRVLRGLQVIAGIG